MGFQKKEEGYALMTVLMLVIVFTMLGLGLMALNISASKQFTIKEKQVQARHLAEMGVLHYKAEIKSLLETQGNQINADENAEVFCNRLSDPVDPKANMDGGAEYYYEASMEPLECKIENDQLIISVHSVGKVTETESSIDANIYVSKQEGTPPPPPADEVEENPSSNCQFPVLGIICDVVVPVVTELTELVLPNGITNKDHLIVERLKGANGLTSSKGIHLNVKKDLYVKEFLDIQNHACIVVQGDFTVKDPDGSFSPQNRLRLGTNVYIFVYGNAVLPAEIDWSGNIDDRGIFVLGDVLVGDEQKAKSDSSIIKPFPSGDSFTGNANMTCKLPGPAEETDQSEGTPPTWTLEDDIDAIYN